MFQLANFLKEFKKQLIIGPFFKLLEAILELFVPIIMASIINIGIGNQDVAHIYKMGGVLILLGVFGLIFALICQYSASVASTGFSANVRHNLFTHINTLSHAELDQMGSNSLITRMTNDVNQVETAVAMFIRLAVRAPFIIVGAAVMALLIDVKMAAIFIVIIPLVSLVLYLVMGRSIPYYRMRQKKLDGVSLITKENLEGARVIRAFSKQQDENHRFLDASKSVTEIATRVGNLSALLNPAIFTILNIAIIAIIWFGGIQVQIGALNQGEVIALVSYTTQISLMLIVLANLIIIFTRASASASRISEVLATKSSIKAGKKSTVAAPQSIPKIEFQDVSFAYTGSDKEALQSLSFKIAKGETVGIIGGTGSGKTTLANLMPRFYDPSKGKILVDGVDVKDYEFAALRQQFGIVFQQAVLFEGTIIENLRFAKEDASMEEIERAVEIAQAKDVIESKAANFNEKIEQGGKNLSGGQRQRLTIARALVGNPEILILDDSSSALDYATDAKLRQALHQYGEELTVVIISQRANSIKHADHILVLDNGKLVGSGTHETLFTTCAVYREICLSQLSQEEVDK